MKYRAVGYVEYERGSKHIYVRPTGSTGDFTTDCNLHVYKILYKHGKHVETFDLGTLSVYNTAQRELDDRNMQSLENISSHILEDIEKEIIIEMFRH